MKPILQALPGNYKTTPYSFGGGGINNNGENIFDISDIDLQDELNLDSEAVPSMKVRDGRKLITTTPSTPRTLSQRNNQYLMTLSGTDWAYFNNTAWVTILGSMAAANAKILDFPTGAALLTVFSDGTNCKHWNGTTVTDIPQMPKTPLFVVNRGRGVALKDQTISTTALNNILDWTSSGDAGAFNTLITKMKGVGSALCSYGDEVLAWSKNSTHELRGTGPKNFSVNDISTQIGCWSDYTPKEVGGILFWLDFEAVQMYTGGGYPKSVSDKVLAYLKRVNWDYANIACAGTDGRRYYLSVPIDGSTTNNKLLVLDVELLKSGVQRWDVEDSTIAFFTEMNGKLYGVQYDGKIKEMNNGTSDDGTAITWYAVSKPFTENDLGEKKDLKELPFLFNLPAGSTLKCEVSNLATGDSDWTVLKEYTTNSNVQTVTVRVPLNIAHNKDCMRIKLSGTGPCHIYKAEKKMRVRRRG